jgi:hypothetical protein
VNGGFDSKFDIGGDYPAGLQNKMSYHEYQAFLGKINDILEKYRSKVIDQLCLYSGASLVSLIPFTIRKKKRSKKRKAELKLLFAEFSATHQVLRARLIEGGPFHGQLVIEDDPNTLYSGK